LITSLCLRGLGHAIASGYVTMASFLCTWCDVSFSSHYPFYVWRIAVQ
jgi:hypothetical protein